MASILNITNLKKSFTNGEKVLNILEEINININEKETFSIVGPSGSGKTTLLGLCAGLDNTTSGKVELCGVDLSHLNEDERAILRNQKVGLGERLGHYPSQLSGGEKQRVAMARAFSNRLTILFADEPTGNLDEESGEKVVNLLLNLNKEAGTTLVIVTHDLELAKKTQKMVILKGGKILKEHVNE